MTSGWVSAVKVCPAFALPAMHQCLVFAGLYGQSTVREVDLVSGGVLRQQALPASDFGEGLVKFGSRYRGVAHQVTCMIATASCHSLHLDLTCFSSGHVNDSDKNYNYAFQLMMSQVRAGQVLSLQSCRSCASGYVTLLI